MTEDVSAGRLVAEVVSDTTGFARDAKKKIDAEVRAIRARIKAEIDVKGLATQAKVAAREASKAAVVRLKVQLDTKGLIGQARAAAVLASSAATVKLKADIDAADMLRKTKTAAAAVSAAKVSVQIGADMSGAGAEVEAFKQRAKRNPVVVPVRADPSGLGAAATALKGLAMAPAIAGGVFLLGTAVVQLGGGLIAVASAASQAVGTVAILPNLIGIVAQGAASLLIGLNGVGGAIGALGKAEEATTAASVKGGAQATATARAVESAARQRTRAAQGVKDAQQSLGDAQKAADDQAISGARAVADAQRSLADARLAAVDRQRAAIEQVSDAEWALARAQESSADAQKALTSARVAAKQRIDDLNAALKAGSLSEEAAALAVRKARENLQDTNWNVMSSDSDKDTADLAVRQAVEAQSRIKAENKATADAAAKANKDGVEGSESVKDARDQVRDALHAEQEDTENLANAQREAAQSQVESARSIELAQRAVGDAVKANEDGEVAAARAIVQAQRGVVEAKQSYADSVRAVDDANKIAAAGSSEAAAAQSALAAAMAKLSPAGRKFAKFIFGLKPEWLGLRDAVQEALLPPIQKGVTSALPLLGTLQDGLVDSATVAGGLGQSLGEALGEKSFNNDVGLIMDSNNRAMQSWGASGLSMVQILRHIAVAAIPLVERFSSWVENLTAGWEEEVKVGRETGKLEAWLDKAGDTAALLGSIIGNVVKALFGMGKAAGPAGLDLLTTFDKISEKWATFANSEDGQAQMKAFFDATKPVTEELGKLVTNLVEFITKAGAGGGGSLAGFLSTLNFILDSLNKLMSIPGVAPVLGFLLTLAGVGGALGLVAAGVLKVGKNLGKLGKFTGFSKLIDGIKGSKDAIDDELPKDKAKGEALDSLDGSAKKTGTSLGGKFVAGVKAASSAVVSGAKAFAGWVAGAARATASAAAFTARLIAQRVAAAAMAIWSGIVRVATLAWAVAQGILNLAMSPIGLVVLAVVAAIAILVGAFIYAWKHSELFRTIVTGALNGLKAAALAVFHALATAVQWVIGFVGQHWRLILGILGGPLVAAVLLTIKYWDQIKAAFWAAVHWVTTSFKKAWAGIKKIFTDPIGAAKAALEAILGKLGLQKVFDTAVSAISKIWEKLQDAAKKPIKFVVETVLNSGLIDSFNWISGKVGGPEIKHIPLPKGFKDGGQFTRDEFSGKIRGRSSNKDNLVAKGPLGQRIGLATGEFIVKAKETMRNLPLLKAINDGRVGSRVGQMVQGGFADGGLFGKIKGAIGSAAAKGKEFGSDVVGALRDPGAWFKKRLAGPLDKMKELGSSPFAETVKAVPRKVLDTVASKAKEFLTGLGGSAGGSGPINPGLDGALQWVKTQVGKPYLWGGVGPDGYDCSGLMGALVNVIRDVEDPFKRLFATGSMPAGIFEKGRGAFSVGWFRGNPGHTAGTLNGENVESRGGKGVLVGKQARGADDPMFNSGVYHLKGFADGGVFAGDAPYDLINPRGKAHNRSADDLLKTMGITFDTGGWLGHGLAGGTGRTVLDNKSGMDEAVLNHGAWTGASSVLDQIASIARQLRTSGASTTGEAPLVGSLAITVGEKKDLPGALDEVDHRLRVIKRGGVYASSTP